MIEDKDDYHAFENRRVLYAVLFYNGSSLDDQEAVILSILFITVYSYIQFIDFDRKFGKAWLKNLEKL
jgi:hypothetical protein